MHFSSAERDGYKRLERDGRTLLWPLLFLPVPHFDAVAFAGGQTSDSKMSR